jgi:hypothetical protein
MWSQNSSVVISASVGGRAGLAAGLGGTVHQDVDTPEGCHDIGHHRLHRGVVRGVAHEALGLRALSPRQPSDRGVQGRLAARYQRDIGAFRRKRASDRQADSAAASGDDRGLAVKLQIHGLRLLPLGGPR